MRFDRSTAAALVAILSVALAQTYTDCNPMEKTCPNDPGLSTSSYTADFTQGSSANASWSAAAYTNIEYGDDGAVFTIATKNDAPTIATDFYIFFGRVSVTMKAASGTGIVSSIVLESADLDEIDWEFLGGSDENFSVQTNYFGKGNTTSYDRVFAATVSTPQDTFHTYTVDWTKDRIEWIIDGTTVRTLAYADAVGGKNFPQTPSQLKLGNWAGGASSSEGTVEWAGGATDFSQGPFKMYVQKVEITNYNPACEYKYSDKTGSYESIDKITSGDSCSAASASTATGTASTSVPSTATSAPTSSQSVGNLEQTKSVVPTTTISATAAATGTGFQTAPSAGTQVPNPTGAGINGTASSTGSGTVTGPTSSSSIASSTGGAALNSVITASSLLSVVLGLLMF